MSPRARIVVVAVANGLCGAVLAVAAALHVVGVVWAVLIAIAVMAATWVLLRSAMLEQQAQDRADAGQANTRAGPQA